MGFSYYSLYDRYITGIACKILETYGGKSVSCFDIFTLISIFFPFFLYTFRIRTRTGVMYAGFRNDHANHNFYEIFEHTWHSSSHDTLSSFFFIYVRIVNVITNVVISNDIVTWLIWLDLRANIFLFYLLSLGES